MSYKTFFIITQESYPWHVLAYLSAFFIVSLLLYIYKNKVHNTNFTRFSGFGTIFSFILILVFLVVSIPNYRDTHFAYESGNYLVVEGAVEHFVPMPRQGHSRESFTVNDVPFSYSSFEDTPGFNQTSVYGGPMRQGLQVRIAYVEEDTNNIILKLDVGTRP